MILGGSYGYGGIRLDFEDLGFTVQDRASGHKKAILSGITGSCVPGRLFALMGEWVQLPHEQGVTWHSLSRWLLPDLM